MNILVIDDDRLTYAEPVIWGLRCESHDVMWCRNVRDVKYGWWEFTPRRLLLAKRGKVPNRVLERLERLTNQRFPTEELLECQIEEALDKRDFKKYGKFLIEKAWQDPLKPKPDCVLLDMMMPAEEYYTQGETNDWKETGASLLRDEDLKGRIAGIPIVVVTVNRDRQLPASLQKEFSQVKAVIHKPVLACQILGRLKELLMSGEEK